MPRFFVDREAVDGHGGRIVIGGGDAFHIARSLRMAEGESVTVCDGEGTDYVCRLSEIRDERCVCEILSSSASRSEPPFSATVFQALVRGERMDTAVMKSVEFGARSVVVFESSRCVVRGTRSEQKPQRWRRIASEAAMQCGRGVIPDVSGPIGFGAALSAASEAELALFCYEKEDTNLLGTLLKGRAGPSTVSVVVGPEGGFSPEEAEAAAAAGLIPVSLGRRILRTESAAAFALAGLCCAYEK
jgi:16S rRNA (uracil1498-N3)-methyltransferase